MRADGNDAWLVRQLYTLVGEAVWRRLGVRMLDRTYEGMSRSLGAPLSLRLRPAGRWRRDMEGEEARACRGGAGANGR